jgi:hypothetical protein
MRRNLNPRNKMAQRRILPKTTMSRVGNIVFMRQRAYLLHARPTIRIARPSYQQGALLVQHGRARRMMAFKADRNQLAD